MDGLFGKFSIIEDAKKMAFWEKKNRLHSDFAVRNLHLYMQNITQD